jgi:hypothetical protein
MEYDFSFNEHFSVETRYAGRERQPVLIVDDFLNDPESMVRYAAEKVQFKRPPIHYPGVVAPVPREYPESLARGLVQLIGTTFGVDTTSETTGKVLSSFFATVTIPPDRAHFFQCLPHTDAQEPGYIAILHYFCDETQGGTALYRHRASGCESVNDEQNRKVQAHMAQDIEINGPLPGYINASNRLFEQTAAFEAKFNRLLIYRSQVLHAGMINANTKLDPNPRVGRLTTNTFVRFELPSP